MVATRRTSLTIGLLLILIGSFVLEQGPQILNPVAESFGLAARYQAESAVLPPTLLTVAASNYTFFSADLRSNIQVRGSAEVADGREIAFYVMNEGNFSQYRAGRPSAVILAKPTAISYNFTFTPNVNGVYYFIFDNQDTSRRVVIFSLSVVETFTVLNPIVQYAGYEILVIGIILSVLGAKSGRRKPESRAVEAVRWKCKFCGAENSGEQTFCENCGRSQH